MGIVEWTVIKFMCGVVICFDFSRIEGIDVRNSNGATVNNNGVIPAGGPCRRLHANNCVKHSSCQRQVHHPFEFECVCNSRYFSHEGKCLPKISLDNDCLETGPRNQCSAANSTCDRRCKCLDGFYKSGLNSCVQKVDLNEPCKKLGSQDPCAGENMECGFDGKCKCKRNFYQSGRNMCSLICGSLDIRNSIKDFAQLENCTIIEGWLQILLLDKEKEDYQDLHFPLLREIRDYLLLYRVYGLKTLKHIFPNLQVIRGMNTFIDYSLVAFEMTDLEEFGLVSLTTIQRGGIWVEKNPHLCYLNTIDWSKIAPKRAPFMNENNNDCVDICPDNCEKTYDHRYELKQVPRCWTKHDCQRNLDCRRECEFCSRESQCCHELCAGGCTGLTSADCTACKYITQDGVCKKSCSPDTYNYGDMRCLTATECLNLKNHHLLDAGDHVVKSCVIDCPAKFSPNKTHCVSCEGCPKVCDGETVDSLSAAKKLSGCTVITDSLNIQMTSGNMDELEKHLGQIEVIRRDLKVFKSSALVSLEFFKKLRLIEGKNPKKGKAMFVVDNPNLKALFTKEVTENLQIKNGNVTFLYNRKLCQSKIKELLWNLNKSIANTSDDIVLDPNNLNGDQIPCSVVKLDLKFEKIASTLVLFKYSAHKVIDARDLISYHIYYREVGDKNVSRFDGRDACSEKVWKVKQSEPGEDNGIKRDFIGALTPFTRYAMFVEAFMLSNAKEGAMTDIAYFTTEPEQPSLVQNVIIKAETGNSLHVSWDPPKYPNGNVTHYYVYWRHMEKNVTEYNLRDYCTQPTQGRYSQRGQTSDRVEKLNNTTRDPSCCACPKSEKQLAQDQNDRKMAVAFENFLQNSIYNKRPPDISDNATLNPLETALQFLPFGNGDDNGFSQNLTVFLQDTNKEKRKGLGNKTEGDYQFLDYPDRHLLNTVPSPTDKKNGTIVNETAKIKNWAIVYDTVMILTNLDHFKEYNIEIVACQERYGSYIQKICSKKAIATARTLNNDTADNIPEYNITATELKNKTGGEVLLKWLPPPRPNGLIIKYLIEYKKVGSQENISVCVSTNVYRIHSRGFKLVKLSAGNFTFRIQAESLADKGAWTSEHYFYVHDRTEEDFQKEKIIAITVASVVGLIVVVIVIVFLVTKHKFGKIIRDMHISINPDYQEYNPDEWEVDRDKVTLIRELGQGSFGMVYEGIAHDIDPTNRELKVAVKTVSERATQGERISFLKEASTMKAFNTYHVVKLIGVVSQGSPPYVVMELMAKGDLKSYLRAHRPEENPEEDTISLKKILHMAGEIADGMAYLADKKFVHRDLAARNCMVAEDLSVKIGDFGMTRDIYETDYYKKGSKGLLPVRWMSPESLKDGLYTSLSDVWSFGVVFWEMSTLAAQPYQGLSNEEVFKYVSYGNIMEKPEGCPDKMFDLMQKCWRYKPVERPTFKEVIEILIPDLEDKFRTVSYYYSEENRQHSGDIKNEIDFVGEHMDDPYDCLDNGYDAFADNQDESQIPLTQGVSVEKIELGTLPSVRVHRSDSEHSEDSLIRENCDSRKLNYESESELNSAIDSNEGSKESSTSKSSNSSYAQMNGFANGYLGSRYPRTTKC